MLTPGLSMSRLPARYLPARSIDNRYAPCPLCGREYREALLWSFFVARHDRDGDGVYSAEERATLLTELGAPDVQKPSVSHRCLSDSNVQRPEQDQCQSRTTASTAHVGNQDRSLPRWTAQLFTCRSVPPPLPRRRAQPDQALAPICGLSGDCIAPLFQNTKNPSVAQVFREWLKNCLFVDSGVIFHLVQSLDSRDFRLSYPRPI